MKILHLADLHLGKKVNGFCMLQEQKFVLQQSIDLIESEKIKAVLICGDVFDRPIPPISALEVFDEYLSKLVKLNIQVFIISGNHDNLERLSYLSTLLKSSGVYVAKTFAGHIEKISLNSDIDIYLMPYLYPAIIKKYFPEANIKNYNDAIKVLVDNTEIDNKKFNILLAHQFVLGNRNDVVLSQSEQKSVGTIDEISCEIFKKFNYTALGHLHCPQKCGAENVIYSGSILKYSFSEINQNKKFHVLEIMKDNTNKLHYFPIKFLHEMKKYSGYIDEFLNKDFYEKINVNDYIHFVLFDEYVKDAKKKLSLIYPNIMLLEFDNNLTKNMSGVLNLDVNNDKTIYEHFCDFYNQQMNVEIDDDKNKIVSNLLAGDVL